ncbi:hypothetical protein MTO96_042302 [Rhipicephalus appendiculatus]
MAAAASSFVAAAVGVFFLGLPVLPLVVFCARGAVLLLAARVRGRERGVVGCGVLRRRVMVASFFLARVRVGAAGEVSDDPGEGVGFLAT